MDLTKLNENLKNYSPAFSDALLEKSIKELNEDPETRNESCLNLYKKFYQKHPHLCVKYNDQLSDPVFLLRFLRVGKFKVDKSLLKLVEWIKTIDGEAWPELAIRIKEKERLIQFVNKSKLFMLKNAAKTGQEEIENLAEHELPWLVISNTDPEIRDSYGKDNVYDYFLDVAATSIISVDYMYKCDEAAQICGLYNANMLDDDNKSSSNKSKKSKSENSLLFFIKNFSTFKKLITIWTSTLNVRSLGSLKLNFKPSLLAKTMEKLSSPFLSDKIKSRNRKLGENWMDEDIFIKENLPRCYGGGLEDSKGLEWIEKYFEM